MRQSFKAVFMAAALSLPLAAVSQAADIDAGKTAPQNFLDAIDYDARIERPDFLSQTDTTPPQALDEATGLFMTVHDNIRRMSIVRPDVTELANRTLRETFRATDSCRYIDYPEITAPVDAEQLKAPLSLLDMCTGPEQDVMEITENMLETMVDPLDHHSKYHTPAESEALSRQFSGVFGGVGILFDVVTEGYLIKDPDESAPAYNAGIRRGDVIISINGIKLEGLELEDHPDLKGPVGEPVDVGVRRNDRTFDVTITRARIRNKPVRSYMLGEDVAYLQLRHFGDEGAAPSLWNNIRELQSEHGNDIRGYILDLRGNTGGFLSQGVAVADMFLNDGKITTIGASPTFQDLDYSATPGDIIDGMPLTVLINDYSASASEVLAAALQDHGRATVVGNRSFGKGSVQSMLSLPNHARLRLTSQLYFTPHGHSIQGRGVIPDIKYVPLMPPKEIPEYEQPIDNLPDDITFDDRRSTHTCSPVADDPVRNTQVELTFVDGSVDYALVCAIETLRNEQRRTKRVPVLHEPSVG